MKTDIEEIVYQELLKTFEEGIDFGYHLSVNCKYDYQPDFYFPNAKLIVECDGKHWHDKDHDRKRDHYFKRRGFFTIRFTDDEIKNNLKSVIKKIEKVYHEREKNISNN